MTKFIINNRIVLSIISGIIMLLLSALSWFAATDHNRFVDADKACAAEYKQLNPRVIRLEDNYSHIQKQLDRMSRRQEIILELLNGGKTR